MKKALLFLSLCSVAISCNSYAGENFTGLNLGLSVGYGKGDSTGDNSYHSANYNNAFDSFKNIPYHYNVKSKGETIGVQLGYNWKLKDNFVFGLELAHDESSIDDKNRKFLAANAFGNNGCEMDSKAGQDLKSFDTLKMRLGFLPNANTNLYLAAGPAMGRVETSIVHKWDQVVGGCQGPAANSDRQTETGYAVSIGAEYLFKSNWSVKAEYTRLGLSDSKLKLFQADDNSHQLTYKFDNDYDLLKVGINYYFK